MLLEADSNSAIAEVLARFEGIGSYRRLSRLDQDLASVTPKAVKALARSMLAESRWNVGVFRPDPGAAGPGPAANRPVAPPPAPTARGPGMLVPPEADLVTPMLPSPLTAQLANGLTALALDNAGEVAGLTIRIEAGARFDPADLPGTAVLAGRLVGAAGPADGSTPAPSLETELRALDATLTESAFSLDAAGANRRVLELDIRVPRAALAATIDVVAARLRHPRYSPEALDEARRSLLAELEGAQDDSSWRATHAATDRLYPPPHAWGRPPEGTATSLQRITLDDIRAFHAKWIRPDRTIVSVAGGDASQSIEAVSRAFGRWERPATSAALAAAETPPLSEGGRVHVSLPHKEQASIVVALPGPRATHDDHVALSALNYLLGETGYAGRLGAALVDTGIAYAVYATMPQDREGGPVLIRTNAVDANEAVRRILDTLAAFARGGVTDPERREAQGYLLGGLLFRFESSSSAATALADLAERGAFAGWSQFADKVRGLTTADLNRVAAIYYDPSRAVVAVAGR
jgi:zinc protease